VAVTALANHPLSYSTDTTGYRITLSEPRFVIQSRRSRSREATHMARDGEGTQDARHRLKPMGFNTTWEV